MIFDLDGTLVDSNDAHAAAFVEAFGEFGFHIGFESVRRLIGMGADKLIARLIGRSDEAIAERKKALFMARHLPRVRPFPRVESLLHELACTGVKLAVASSAAKDELDALLELTHASVCFAQIVGADDAARSKPDPDIVRAALDKLALPAEQRAMVGDTPYDASAARRAGLAFVGVRCGGWLDADLQPAIGVYDDPADLLDGLDSLVKGRGSARQIPS